MKKFFPLAAVFFLWFTPASRAQDAATEEKLNQLTGKIEDVLASLENQKKRLSELAKEIDSVRDQQGKHNPSYATQDDLKRLAEKVKEVDNNREHDKENHDRQPD